jgi:GAF domain-containing protein/HPt (histidine-containing phosphotransfer) domain-containing protein
LTHRLCKPIQRIRHPTDRSIKGHVFAAFIAHWRAPVREGFDAFARALRAGLDLGDPRHSAFTRVHVLQRMLLVGSNLEETREEGEQAIVFLEQSQAGNALAGARAAQRVVSRLAGRSSAAHPSDEFTSALAAFGNAQWLFSYGQAEAMASVVLGDLASAEAWLAFTEPVTGAGLALFAEADYNLFRALILVRRCADQAGEARESTLAALLAIQEKLRVWSENCPANFAHKYKLCSAEIARAENAPTDEVLALYDEAIAAAGDGFVHIRALTSELIAEYWAGKRQHKVARHFCEEAYYLYERWGAHAKLRQLELRYPDWLGHAVRELSGARTTIQRTTTREDRRAGALDLESIIKATQAISSEVKADRLFARLMATIIENAGAERGCLILDGARENELVVAARAGVHGDVPDAARAIPLPECGELCPELVRYVARTRDTVVVDDATSHGPFADYAYIHQNAVKSLLCMPILNQGKLVAILYAENNATTHAFTSERLSLLQVIASQAAISITNARLYDRLEDKVAERTRELVDRNRDIAAMLNSMQQGIFTVGENMTIQPQYSAHLEHLLGRTDIAGSDCLHVVFEGSNVGADALEAMRSALMFTLGESSVFAEVNSSHLVREFARVNEHGEVRHFEVDWNPIIDEADIVQRVLVALRDVTVVKHLKETVAKSARELEMLGHILDAGLEPFQRFCASARALLTEVAAVIGGRAGISRDALELCFRNMHTIKGNARMLGLGHLVDTAHLAEEPYAELRLAAGVEPDARKLEPGIHAVLAAIDEYERVYQSKLGEAAHGASSGSTRAEQALRDIQRAIKDAQNGAPAPAQVLRSVERAIERAQAVPLSEVVKECARVLPSLARELCKAPPLVDCEIRGVLLTPAWTQVMRDVLSHVFRNALDHGLEPPEERELQGKPAQGRIRVRAERNESTILVRIADDGRGLRLGALRDRTGILDATDDELASAVFVPGVSTATTVSGMSGRGVGMGAIRSFIEQHGGDVRLVFTGESRSDCRPFELVIRLPEGAVAGADDSKAPLQLSGMA